MSDVRAPTKDRAHGKYERLVKSAQALPAIVTAIAHPCDEASLESAVEAAKLRLIIPILIGPIARVHDAAARAGLDIGPMELIDAAHSEDAAEKAVGLVRSGRAEALMKGSLHTDELTAAVVTRESGIRTARRISHCFIMDVPGHANALIITDAAVNIAPTLEDKVDIVQNAIDLAHAMGVAEVRVAILSAMETVNPKVPSTIEAAALCKMADRGQITGALLDGPLALDNAIRPEAAPLPCWWRRNVAATPPRSLVEGTIMSGTIRPVLTGQKALVVGIANDSSIAYGCAKAFRAVGAELAVTWLNDKARPYVEPLARELGADIMVPLHVGIPGQLEAVFEAIARQWRKLDILVHSIAFAPKEELQGGLLACSAEGFAKAMDISCHSFIRMARLAAPLMTDGGSMFAMSYYGANRVVANYNVMGPVKAALEAACRYLAYELGNAGICVHAISPGPLKTRAASGLKDFELLLNEAAQKAPLGELVDIMDVGFTCAYLATPFARRITGGTVYVDGGANIVA